MILGGPINIQMNEVIKLTLQYFAVEVRALLQSDYS